MNYLDNAIKQLTGAHEDLAADNQQAAQVEYGRMLVIAAVFLIIAFVGV